MSDQYTGLGLPSEIRLCCGDPSNCEVQVAEITSHTGDDRLPFSLMSERDTLDNLIQYKGLVHDFQVILYSF